jgi:hypothetical protein
MAAQEAEIGVSSTYFVLLRTEFYNLFSERGAAALEEISSLGHSIGLHFDAALYAGDETALDEAARRECELLASAVGREIGAVAFHRPAGPLMGTRDHLGGRVNVYGPRYVRRMGYCSDSRGGWHHGHPLDHPAIAAGHGLQLLIHPIWWQEPLLQPAAKLLHFLAERAAFLDRELGQHSSIHRVESGKA